MAVPDTRYTGGPEAFVGYQTIGDGPTDVVSSTTG